MRRRSVAPLAAVATVVCIGRGAADSARSLQSVVTSEATPLRQSAQTSPVFKSDFVAWVGSPVCDDDGNVHLLVNPHVRPQVASERAQHDVGIFNTTEVLRISADGKHQVTIKPTAAPKFSNAKDLTLSAITVDQAGSLFMLVQATWGQRDRGEESRGQYILSFDKKGKYNSYLEVDWRDISVQQFVALGSGGFLLRGHRTNTSEERIGILSSDGSVLQDIARFPTKMIEELSLERSPQPDHMARGGDGRVYFVDQNSNQRKDLVYAFSSDGAFEEAFSLARLPRQLQLIGWNAAGNRLAATYGEPDPSDLLRRRWWIAVYSNVASHGELQAVYGPAPSPPLCYRHELVDRFTFLGDGGRLVTMSP